MRACLFRFWVILSLLWGAHSAIAEEKTWWEKEQAVPGKSESAETSNTSGTKKHAKPSNGLTPTDSPEKAVGAKKHKSQENIQPATGGFTIDSDQDVAVHSIALKTDSGCFIVEVKNSAGEILSCKTPPAIVYTKQNCQTKEILEIGETEALVTCEEKNALNIHFRSKSSVISASLLVNRQNRGRRGFVTSYIVSSAKPNTAFEKMLPEPVLKEIAGKTAEESPIQFKFSGFAHVEFERSRRYGYDVGGTNLNTSPNFTETTSRPTRTTGTFFSNLNFSASKDQTTLQSIFELGEIYAGDTNSGGGQGARSTILEVRNIYLEHKYNEELSGKAGVITSISDPRSFIYNDHTSSAHVSYASPLLNLSGWYGIASKSRPAATNYLNDHFISLSMNLNFLSGIKNTLFLTYREQANANFAKATSSSSFDTVTGKAKYYWAGGTVEYAGFDPISAEGTLIGNWSSFQNQAVGKDSYFSYLADLKLGYTLPSPQIGLALEGLLTPGAKNATDTSTGNKVLSKRKAFNSPVGAAYLMTIATNDGVDEAPGTPKQSIIANLGQDEGLRMLIASLSTNLSKRFTVFARHGQLWSQAESSLNSNRIGSETDIGSVYQMTPAATISVEYGYFEPGNFYLYHSSAQLLSVKYKLSL